MCKVISLFEYLVGPIRFPDRLPKVFDPQKYSWVHVAVAFVVFVIQEAIVCFVINHVQCHRQIGPGGSAKRSTELWVIPSPSIHEQPPGRLHAPRMCFTPPLPDMVDAVKVF